MSAATKRLPDFLIIGAQKCGTTSLYSALLRHPNIDGPPQKEVHFFDLAFDRGIDWYRDQFPHATRPQVLLGEATPYYLFHPHVPRRIRATLPDVKLIALLRNPVARAYSHYQHERRAGVETLSFEEAIETEAERLNHEVERLLADPNYHSFNHRHYSYLSRGIYVEQLNHWLELFPRDQLLVLLNEELAIQPASVLERVFQFLNMPTLHQDASLRCNSSRYPPMNRDTERYLHSYFRPHNELLYECLAIEPCWDT